MTLAERYNLEAARLLPHMAPDLQVDPAITRATEIDEIVFRRGEFLGGMACAILAMIEEGRDDPRVGALVEQLVRGPIVQGVKALVAAARGEPDWARPRPPLQALDAEAARALGARLDAFAPARA